MWRGARGLHDRHILVVYRGDGEIKGEWGCGVAVGGTGRDCVFSSEIYSELLNNKYQHA